MRRLRYTDYNSFFFLMANTIPLDQLHARNIKKKLKKITIHLTYCLMVLEW